MSLVTVERVRKGSFFDDERSAAGVLPALYVGAIAEAPGGARPYGLWGEYGADADALAEYGRAARTPEGFRDWLARHRVTA